jgi:hypothetical protein
MVLRREFISWVGRGDFSLNGDGDLESEWHAIGNDLVEQAYGPLDGAVVGIRLVSESVSYRFLVDAVTAGPVP